MRDRQLLVWLVLAACVLLFLNLPDSITGGIKTAAREAVAPVQEAVGGLWSSVRRGASSVRGYGTALQENQRLAGEITLLKAKLQDSQSLERENSQLRAQLDFKARSDRYLIAAEIVGRDPDGWWQTVRINRGSVDGVDRDMPVISVEGLVGRTLSVSSHTADVLLISDPTCQISARMSRAGAFGILTGRGPNWRGQVICRMEFINKSLEISEGDEVVTSGLGGIYPKGLFIGKVDRVHSDHAGLYQTADVVSTADLGTMQYVFVLRSATGREGAPK